MIGYVVESPVTMNADGKVVRVGTASFWTDDKAKAIRVAAERPERTWREVSFDEMPAVARENLERAHAHAADRSS